MLEINEQFDKLLAVLTSLGISLNLELPQAWNACSECWMFI